MGAEMEVGADRRVKWYDITRPRSRPRIGARMLQLILDL